MNRRPRDMFIIDFGTDMNEWEAAQYEAPFAYVQEHVQPSRMRNRIARHKEALVATHVTPVVDARGAQATVTIHCHAANSRSTGCSSGCGANAAGHSQLVVIAREDDYMFGVLHSQAHEWWSLRMGSRMEE